jgi:hypothetical protein
MKLFKSMTRLARAGAGDLDFHAFRIPGNCRVFARVAGCLVLALLALLTAANPANASLCIRVSYRFAGHPPSGRLVHTMQDEVAAIWKPYAVHILWQATLAADQCARVDGSFDVLVSSGVQPGAKRTAAPVLGRTWIPPASIVHMPIIIDFDKTMQLISEVEYARLLDVARSSTVGSYEMGRALGRVLAHEIGHVLLAEPRHEPHGLMRSSFPSEDLLARERIAFALSQEQLVRLRDRERTLEARLRPPE